MESVSFTCSTNPQQIEPMEIDPVACTCKPILMANTIACYVGRHCLLTFTQAKMSVWDTFYHMMPFFCGRCCCHVFVYVSQYPYLANKLSFSLSLLLKWISIRLCKQCCTMMQSLMFSYAKGFGKIQMESSLSGVQNATFWAIIYQVTFALAGWCCVGCQVSLMPQQMSVFIVWTLTAKCQPFNVGSVSQILVLLKWNKKVCEGYKKRTNWVKKRKELWVSWIWLEYSW